MVQSSRLAWRPELPDSAFLPGSEGPCGDAQLESAAGERSGQILATAPEQLVLTVILLLWPCHKPSNTFAKPKAKLINF